LTEEKLETTAPPAAPRNGPRSRRWSAAALLLVVALLLGSVLIPARFSSRILRLLVETRDVVEPARRAESELELTLEAEATALQEYSLTGDSAVLARYHASSIGTDRQLAQLDSFAKQMSDRAVEEVAEVRTSIREWRRLNQPFSDRHLSRAELTTLLRTEQASRDSIFSSVVRLESYLASQAAEGRDRVAASEERSLVVNGSLVLVALATLFAVAALVRRERHLSAMLERRTDDEAALREAAEAFAGKFETEDVTDEVARSAMAVLRARAAFVEVFDADTPSNSQVVVRAAVGIGAPRLGTTAPRAGSLAEAVSRTGEPMLIPNLVDAELACFPRGSILTACSCIVVPLVNEKESIGALYALSRQEFRFGDDDLQRARTLAHLVALAYEKVRLLNEAREGRRELERVMSSRSRLMRGFSHDIKNPLGAADGYADLLASGIYGELSSGQRESVERVRELIHTALALIGDLHELARAETGKVALFREAVVLQDVLRASGEEFRAVATRRGLALFVELPDAAMTVETDALRVRQILSNLVSNAIKYTDAGSVVLRLRHAATDTGPWAAIDVADTGRGIAENQLSLLFEEFARLGETDKPGAGLGLAISQRLAELLAGRISVESTPGRGTQFTLWLPIVTATSSASPSPIDDKPHDPLETHSQDLKRG